MSQEPASIPPEKVMPPPIEGDKGHELIAIRDLKVHFDLGYDSGDRRALYLYLMSLAGALIGLSVGGLLVPFILPLFGDWAYSPLRVLVSILIAIFPAVGGAIAGYYGFDWIGRLIFGEPVRRSVKAVDGVSIDIYPGETLGLVGESGCGKTTLGRAVLRLTEPTSGHVLFRGLDLTLFSKIPSWVKSASVISTVVVWVAWETIVILSMLLPDRLPANNFTRFFTELVGVNPWVAILTFTLLGFLIALITFFLLRGLLKLIARHSSEKGMRKLRRHLQIIFQDPYASLNPRMTVGQIIGEPIKTFHGGSAGAEHPTKLKVVGLILSAAAGIFVGYKVAKYIAWPFVLSFGGVVYAIIGIVLGGLIGYGAASFAYYLIVRKTLRIILAVVGGATGWGLAFLVRYLLKQQDGELGGDYTLLQILLMAIFFAVGWYVAARLKPELHTFGGKIDNRVQELMETVGLSKRFLRRFPHEFSGGQRQRIGIARALAVDPDFIVADEPISALDVSIQAQIMNLMERLQREKNLTYLFISHDLRAVRHLSDRVAVMYLGKLVEIADARVIYDEPLMPYTKALISAVPVPDPEIEADRQRIVLEGDVPSPINPPPGCRFHTRCPYAIQACKEVVPPLAEIRPNHFAACIRISPEQPDIEKVAPGDAPGLRDAQRVIAT